MGLCRNCAKSENECTCDIKEQVTPETPQEDVEWITDETTNSDYISMAWHVYDLFEAYDPMGNKAGEQRKRRVQRMCLQIAEKCILEVHTDLFDVESEEE